MQIVSPTKTFDTLIANNNNGYVLPDDVTDRITQLFDQIGFSSNTPNTFVNQYNATPVYKSSPQEHDGRANFLKQQARKQKPQNSWKEKPAFAVTKFALLDESENIIDNLRTELNKINDKTLETRMQNIINLLNDLLETSSNDSSGENAGFNNALTMFFETAISNKNPTLYANFYSLLYAEFSEPVTQFLDKTYQAYIASFENITNVSETNYDEYCDFTAANLRRKNISCFIAKATLKGFMPNWNTNFVCNLLTSLFQQVIEKVEYKAKQKEVEEITENIVALFAALGTFIQRDSFDTYIQQVNAMKPGDKPGLTSRTKFKYMDLKSK